MISPSGAMAISRGSGTDKVESHYSLSSSSPSLMLDGGAAARWSKEVMGAMEAHLGLLQQQYHSKQHWQNEACNAANHTTWCANGQESDDCVSIYMNGHSCDDTADVEQNSNGAATQLVDLLNHQATALPEGWEQHLDLRTGQVFYIHWKSCRKSNVDPRKMVHLANERILEMMHHISQEPSYIELHCRMQEEELLNESPSE